MNVKEYMKNWMDTEDMVFYPCCFGHDSCSHTYEEIVDYGINDLFKYHKGKVAVNNKRVLILDWCSKYDYTDDDIHYILDKKIGTLTISGDRDLKSGVFSWPHGFTAFTAEDFLKFCKPSRWTIMDFLQSDWKYMDNQFLAMDDLEKVIQKILNHKESYRANVEKDMNRLRELFLGYEKNLVLHREFEYLNNMYKLDNGPLFWGQRVSPLVYFWIIGFYMASQDTGLIE